MTLITRIYCAAFAAIVFSTTTMSALKVSADDTTIVFSRDIRPILASHCFKCHGPDEASREGNLRLDTEEGARAALEKDGDLTKLIARITSADAELVMPPPDAKKPLKPAQIEKLTRWVEAGAVWGAHWSFEPLIKPAVPEVSVTEVATTQNPIDHFVQARLATRGVQPAPEASGETLIRRVTLDLTGLAATTDEVDAFVADTSNNAWESVVDRLLNSPAYGERMAWTWLDAARYADSNGYQGDNERTMWPWRDWVIDAFNTNMPYDQFTIWQLAGDQLPEATFEQKLATGFLRNHMINGEGGRIAEENRVDYVMDMTETTGTVWLGLTMNCCRCHDHKFDPLMQRDYYSLSAFFNQTPVDGGGGNPQTPPVLDAPTSEQRQQVAEMETQLADLNQRLKQLEKEPATDAAYTELLAKQQAQTKSLNDLRGSFPKVMVMQDRPELRKTFILTRGLYSKPADEVSANVPEKLPRLPEGEAVNRLALARWIVSDDNPLTARVTVNRFWQMFFGIGLVKTTEDFGVQGEIPLHQDLLDWLAADFREHGWNVKRLVRQIVTSHTYRQTSGQKASHGLSFEEDPENRDLSRGARFRLPSWMLRDQALAASGLLVQHSGGVPVKGYQPTGVWEETTFGRKQYQQDRGDALYRRSLYTFWRRIVAPTMFFDNASRQTCTVKTFRTNTPLHALLTLNDVTFVESARALSERVLLADIKDDAGRVDEIFRRVLSRHASDPEQQILVAAVARSRSEIQADVEAAKKLLAVGESKRNEQLDAVEHAAWTSLVLAVMNLDEALTKE